MTYQNERMGRSVLGLVEGMERTQAVECDVLDEESVVAGTVDAAASVAPLGVAVHSVAFANRDDLEGAFSRTGRGWVPDRARGERVLAAAGSARRRGEDGPTGGAS